MVVGRPAPPVRGGMARLIAVQLETCHHNTDGTAWYAYYDGEPDWSLFVVDALVGSWKDEVRAAAKKDGAPLSPVFDGVGQEEAPNALSKHAGLRRYLVALAG